MKKVGNALKRFVNRISPSSSPTSNDEQLPAISKKANVRQSAKQASKANILQLLNEFSEKHNLNVDDSGKQNRMALLLQRQMEMYDADVERRRQRFLEEAQTNVSAVVGGKKATASARATDDALPYVPKRIDWNAMAKRAASKDKPASSQAPKSAAKPVPSTNVITQATSSQVPSQPSISAATVSAALQVPVVPSASDSAPLESSTVSSSDSSSSSEGESGRLTDVLDQIVADAQNPEKARQQEAEFHGLSIDDMINMSRSDVEKFDKLINENTKASLFVSQPKAEEFRAWHSGNAVRPSTYTNEIDLSGAQVETRVFCRDCRPRHTNYPFQKNVHPIS